VFAAPPPPHPVSTADINRVAAKRLRVIVAPVLNGVWIGAAGATIRLANQKLIAGTLRYNLQLSVA
jgi:hypothetical protein